MAKEYKMNSPIQYSIFKKWPLTCGYAGIGRFGKVAQNFPIHTYAYGLIWRVAKVAKTASDLRFYSLEVAKW